jgi:acyl carrier protein
VTPPVPTTTTPTLTEAERAVAHEIVRIAREELAFEPAAMSFAGELGPGGSRGPAGGTGLAANTAGGGGELLAAALDSLQLLSLVVAVEDRFRVVLAEEDAAGTRTLADLARLVASRTEAGLLPPSMPAGTAGAR